MTTKGQVVIPKSVRGRLRWRTGTRLRVTTDGRRVVLDALDRSEVDEWLARVVGCVRTGDPIGDLEAEHRAEVLRDARRRP